MRSYKLQNLLFAQILISALLVEEKEEVLFSIIVERDMLNNQKGALIIC